MSIEDSVDRLEPFLTDCITQTPLRLKFRASEVADYMGEDTATISMDLQTYRSVQGDKTLSTAAFVIATYERGPKSVWFILSWPGMTRQQRTMAGALLVEHEIRSTIEEDLNPILRNIEVQFIPAVERNKAVYRTMVPVNIAKLDGYHTMLLKFRSDVAHIRPMALRRVATLLDAVIGEKLDRIDILKVRLSSLT